MSVGFTSSGSGAELQRKVEKNSGADDVSNAIFDARADNIPESLASVADPAPSGSLAGFWRDPPISEPPGIGEPIARRLMRYLKRKVFFLFSL